MIFREPEVEFVPIDVAQDVTTASFVCPEFICVTGKECSEYGVETCLGDAPMNHCDDDNDWL